jgi:hypothetical protein
VVNIIISHHLGFQREGIFVPEKYPLWEVLSLQGGDMRCSVASVSTACRASHHFKLLHMT